MVDQKDIEEIKQPLSQQNKKDFFQNATVVIHSSDLFGEEKNKMVIIQHRDTFYRLMVTRQGKLILTK